MTEQRTSVIEVGDEVVVDDEYPFIVTKVSVGKYGLLVCGGFTNGFHGDYTGYWPYELSPSEIQQPWYGWSHRGTEKLPSGLRCSTVGLLFADPRETIEEYDAEWERTIEAMRSEEMQSRPTDIRLDS